MKDPLYIIPALKFYGIQPRGVLHVGAGNCEESEEYRGFGFKRVVWVDAIPPSVEILKREGTNGTLVINAVLDAEIREAVEFHVMSNGSSSSLLPLGLHSQFYPTITEKEVMLVDTTTGEALMAAHPETKECNVLNVDVQGAELRVLCGFKERLDQFDCVFSEVYVDEVYQECGKLQYIDFMLWARGFIRMETWIKPKEGWGNAFWVKKGLL